MNIHKTITAISNRLLFLLIFIAISFYDIKTSYSQIILPSLVNQDQIIRMQNQEIERQRIQKEMSDIKKKKNLIKKRKRIAVKKDKINKCFKIKKVEFNKNTIISQKDLDKITSSYLGKCFGTEVIGEIKNKIYSQINKDGYITSQITLPEQNVSTGIVKLEIFPGKINKLVLNKNKITDKMQSFMLFGDLREETLDVNDLNQGLYQINKLPSSNAKMKIIPSQEEGYSDIKINNENSFPVRANIAHDNLGNDFTGVKRTTFSSGLDNILSLSENINLSFTNNLNDSNAKKEMESVSASIAIPFRYYTISYNYSDTNYMGKTTSGNGTYTVNGYSRRKTITLERLLINEQSNLLNFSSSLIMQDSGSVTLLNEPVGSNKKKLSILDLSLSLSKSSKNYGLYIKPSIIQGLDNFGADKDQPGTPLDQAKNQYRLYKLYLNISKPIEIDNKRITFSSEIDSQLSKDTLNGSQQFSVGGYYSVRGFRENYIAGDSGYYIRNKLNANIGSFLSPSLKNYPTIASKLYNLSIEPFFDYGYVKDRIGRASGRLSGVGISTIFNSKHFDTSITYSKGLGQSKLIDPALKKEDQLIYFQVSAGF